MKIKQFQDQIGKLYSISSFHELKEEVHKIFMSKLTKRQNFLYGIRDETILLKHFFELMTVNNNYF